MQCAIIINESHQLSWDAMVFDEDKANRCESGVELRSLRTASKIGAREYAAKIHHWNLGLRHDIHYLCSR